QSGFQRGGVTQTSESAVSQVSNLQARRVHSALKICATFPRNVPWSSIMSVRVKICGITSLQDALAAVESGADALGFVFFEQSPRYIAPANAGAITRQLPGSILKVGVFVDE